MDACAVAPVPSPSIVTGGAFLYPNPLLTIVILSTRLSMILTDLFSANTTNNATTVASLGSTSSINIPHAIEVQIVSVLPTNSYNNKLVDEIPMNVKLPKTIWYDIYVTY